MRTRDIQRIVAVLKGWNRPRGVACLVLTLLLPMGAADAQPSASTVSAALQRSRDDERLRILRDELARSESLAQSLARRRAERLAAADRAGAEEVEAQGLRVREDIAGLQREIATTMPTADSARHAAGRAEEPVTVRLKPVALATHASSAWWDVYAKGGRDPSAPLSHARPSGDDGTRAVPYRRPE